MSRQGKIEKPRRLKVPRAPKTWAVLAACASLLLAVDAARAASVTVKPAAAHTGSNGLEVAVGSSCTSGYETSVDGQTVSGTATYEACGTLTSSGTTISSGDVTFRAGHHLVFGDGFSVQNGASFVAEVDSSLFPDAFIWDETPDAETHYSAAFYFDPTGLTMAAGDQYKLLSGHSGDGVEWFSLIFGRHYGLPENRLVLEARRDDGTIATTDGVTEIFLPATGWHWIALEWKPTTVGSYGFIRLYVDGFYKSGLGPLYNSQAVIDRVELGGQEIDPGTSGFFHVDEFISRVAGPISEP